MPQKTPKSSKCRNLMKNTRFDLINGRNSVFCAASTVMKSIFEKKVVSCGAIRVRNLII